MGIRKGTSQSVFTGGWFDTCRSFIKKGARVFTRGWFDAIPDDIHISATAQTIEYVAGTTSVVIGYVVNSTASTIEYKAASTTIEVQESFDYLNQCPLPNGYFTKCDTAYDREREMFQYMQMEAYNTFGVPCHYYKVSYDGEYDGIWGECNDRAVVDYWSNVNTWFELPRENKTWNKWEFKDLNNFIMYCSKLHFDHVTSGYIPQMGDLIQSNYDGKIYEIVEIKEEEGMFLIDKRYTWEFYVKPFEMEQIRVSGTVSGSPLSAYSPANMRTDLLDITNDIDARKEEFIYKPKDVEQPNKDPFAQW